MQQQAIDRYTWHIENIRAMSAPNPTEYVDDFGGIIPMTLTGRRRHRRHQRWPNNSATGVHHGWRAG